MISAFGAILLIAAGGYAGFSALEHLRTVLRCAETILDASRDMRTEILCHRTPLPQLLERLGARYPRLFHDAENACMLVREFSFLSVWTASIRCAALPKPLEVPPFGFIRRWALPRAAFLPFCFFSLYISAALWQTVGG